MYRAAHAHPRGRSSRHQVPQQTTLPDFLKQSSTALPFPRLNREAVAWLERAIGRPALLVDLTPRNLAATERCVFGHGFGNRRARQLRKALCAIANEAHRRAGLSPIEPGRAATIALRAADLPAWLASPPGPGTLSESLDRLCEQLATSTVKRYRRAVSAFDRFMGRYAVPVDLSPKRQQAFRRHLLTAGRTESVANTYLEIMLRVARSAEPSRFPLLRRRNAPLPPPEAESIRAFYHEVYEPQQLIGATWQCRRDNDCTLRRLFEFNGGRDTRLSELSDQFISRFLKWLLAGGRRPVTVNRYRAHLLAWWRLAAERGLVDVEPKVKKLRESLDVPDAWSEEELARIFAAPTAMRWRPTTVAGIQSGLYFRALLLVAYWTGMRIGTIRQLAWHDIDLETAAINVPGEKFKNRRGQRYRIGVDAVEALRAICKPERSLVFPWPHDPQWFCERLRQIVAAAGVPASSRRRLTLMHKMRRSVATLVAQKLGLAAACELLGHSSREITRRYVDPSKLPGQDATEILPVLTGSADQDTSDELTYAIACAPMGMLRLASQLLAAGNSLAAAAMVRVTLERWLRSECDLYGCRFPKTAGLFARATALRNLGRLTQRELRSVRDVVKPANKAVHGCDVDNRKVEAMIAALDGLIGRDSADEGTEHKGRGDRHRSDTTRRQQVARNGQSAGACRTGAA